MHPCLRPELRAAHRVLRVVAKTPKSSPRIVVRSFAHFSRLREQQPDPTSSGGNTSALENVVGAFQRLVNASSVQDLSTGEHEIPKLVKRNIDDFYGCRLRNQLSKGLKQVEWELKSEPSLPIPIPDHGVGPEDFIKAEARFRRALVERNKVDNWQDADRRKAIEQKELALWFQQGLVPPNHRLVEKVEDVPSHLTFYGAIDRSIRLPYLYSEDPARIAHWYPVPGLDQVKEPNDLVYGRWYPRYCLWDNILKRPKGVERYLDDVLAGVDKSKSEGTDAVVKISLIPTEDHPSTSPHHGSWQKRRKRARDNKPAHTQSPLPKWFYKSNVLHSQPDSPYKPLVVTVPQASTEHDTATASLSDDAQIQITPGESTSERPPDTPVTVRGRGRSGPSPEDGTSGGSGSLKVPTSTIVNTKALGNDRYFVDEAQYEELFATFKGRLQPPSANLTPPSPDTIDHLTILHGARDSEILLQALVRDLCSSVGADRIRLDAQDISELLALAEAGKDSGIRASANLSWRIYKLLYETDENSESSPTRQEDDNDEEDGEDNPEDIPHFELPVALSMTNIGAKLPDMLNQMRRMRNRNAMFEADFGHDMALDKAYASVVSSVLSSAADAQKVKASFAVDSITDKQDSKDTKEAAPSRPLIVHIENYKLLQDHDATALFLAGLMTAANERRSQGHIVMVVGTDSLRDFSKTGDPRSILDNQAKKSYGASTAIVLTPVYPNREAELAPIEDRKTRIRNINVRHLQQILKSRGLLFHGLEDGFWDRDYSEEIGQRDFDALSPQFWSYVQVQRIAAIMAGIQSDAPLEDACAIIAASDESKVAWAQRNQPDLFKQQKKEEDKPQARHLRSITAKATKHEKKLLSGVIEPKNIQTTFDDIHIPLETIDSLKMLTAMSLQRPEAFRYGVLKSDRIPGLLLYGPPGTGKTLAAKAVAKESGATMLEVSAADLNDMYVGEGEKNVQALFSLAKKLSPCVVFLDEADAMFAARSSSRRASHRDLLNQFLKEWDGMSNDAGSAFIMVATNRPMDLDDAVLRRLPRRLLVDLPTEADRLKILHIHLRNEKVDTAVNLEDLAKRTPFYSGSDLKNVAVAAALNAVRDENDAANAFRREKPDETFVYPETRILTQAHFDKALDEITASISQDMSTLKEIKKFDEQYGDKKGRKKKSPKWGFKSAAEADKVLDTVKVRSD